MVKVGGKRNTQKVCKKQVNFSKTEGKFIKVGEKVSTESENFSKIGGKSETVGKCIMVSGGMDAPGRFDNVLWKIRKCFLNLHHQGLL